MRAVRRSSGRRGDLQPDVWRNNKVHDNMGHGIWSDGNVRALIEGNIVSNNSKSDLQHELSWDSISGTIPSQTMLRRSIGQSCWWGANILINTARTLRSPATRLSTATEPMASARSVQIGAKFGRTPR